MLLVKAIGQRQGQLPQLVACAVQRFTTELQHAADAAAANLAFRDFVSAIAAIVTERQARRVFAGRHRRHLIGGVALHQRQTVGEGHGIGITVLLGDLNADHLVKLRHQLIALIQQGVRLAAAAAGPHLGDFVIQAGDLLAVSIDLVGAVAQLLVDARIHIAQILVRIVELIHQAVGLA
ncbi:Uncharacterised protein [Serratia fonticola]|uniref:Uncharacterized protein n=1 Tax=Serratia fonticola TaxID=47917 RepID=A0A4U9WKH4_SERFO|nr:Uncharacterised protein [Serratia fonticola]